MTVASSAGDLIWVGLDQPRNEQILPRSATSLYVDNRVLDELVREFALPVYWYCFRMLPDQATAKDRTQDVFVKIYKKRIRGPNWLAYLLRVAKTVCLDAIDKDKGLVFKDGDYNSENEDTDLESASQDTEPHTSLVLEETLQEFLEWLQEVLPPQQRSVMLLYVDGYSIEESARILGLKEQTVKNYRGEAVNKIVEALANNGGLR